MLFHNAQRHYEHWTLLKHVSFRVNKFERPLGIEKLIRIDLASEIVMISSAKEYFLRMRLTFNYRLFNKQYYNYY